MRAFIFLIMIGAGPLIANAGTPDPLPLTVWLKRAIEPQGAWHLLNRMIVQAQTLLIEIDLGNAGANKNVETQDWFAIGIWTQLRQTGLALFREWDQELEKYPQLKNMVDIPLQNMRPDFANTLTAHAQSFYQDREKKLSALRSFVQHLQNLLPFFETQMVDPDLEADAILQIIEQSPNRVIESTRAIIAEAFHQQKVAITEQRRLMAEVTAERENAESARQLLRELEGQLEQTRLEFERVRRSVDQIHQEHKKTVEADNQRLVAAKDALEAERRMFEDARRLARQEFLKNTSGGREFNFDVDPFHDSSLSQSQQKFLANQIETLIHRQLNEVTASNRQVLKTVPKVVINITFSDFVYTGVFKKVLNGRLRIKVTTQYFGVEREDRTDVEIQFDPNDRILSRRIQIVEFFQGPVRDSLIELGKLANAINAEELRRACERMLL